MIWVFFRRPFEVSGPFKNPEIIEMNVFGFSHKQIDKLLYQIEAE